VSQNGTNLKIVYTIVHRAHSDRKHWVRIGAAFENRDGSLNVRLDAVPTNGELHIREYTPFDSRRGPAGTAAPPRAMSA
jgi:hypothetical protein